MFIQLKSQPLLLSHRNQRGEYSCHLLMNGKQRGSQDGGGPVLEDNPFVQFQLK
jgi:hypothetical protein